MPDWTIAIDDGLTERGRWQHCLLCGSDAIRWWDLLDIAGLGVGYSLCHGCRRRDPEARRVKDMLTARYTTPCA